MIFHFLHQREKKWLLLFLACLFSWWLFSAQAICWASGTYTITEAELNQLQTNLDKLEQLSKTQEQESMRLKATLETSKQELTMLQNKLTISTEQLKQAQNSLDNANQLLKQYADEEKRTRLRIKAQRNFWIFTTITAIIVAVTNHN